ncbi:MAG: hypothetical protein KGI71_05870 [Patescibacteria group bacterium]|nr:hypothetical protein [Patescibacteria group bacterium]
MASPFPEGNTPEQADFPWKSLQKINDILLNAGIKLAAGSALGASEEHIGNVGGSSAVASGSVVRPANTTAYAAGQVVNSGAVITPTFRFPNVARKNGGTGIIISATLVDFANQSTLLSAPELWIFSASFTGNNDGASWTPSAADLANLIAVIPLSNSFVGNAASGASGNVTFTAAELSRAFKCGAASESLFGALVVRNAYTPVASEQFTALLGVIQD